MLGIFPSQAVIGFVKARSGFREDGTTRTFLRLHSSPQAAASCFRWSIRARSRVVQRRADRQTTGQTGNVSAKTSIAARPLGKLLPLSLFPELFNISSSVSSTLQNNHSSSYTSMSLHIDLIEHGVDKVQRNPLGALFPSSQQSLIALPKPSNDFFLFSLSFVLTLHYLLPRFLPPSSTFSPFSPFPALLLLLFASTHSSCVPL